jgi:hypothetical protein
MGEEKVFFDGETFVKLSELLPLVIESVVDSRFKYLKELEYENHRQARKILDEEYKPSVEKLKQIIEIIT